MHASLPEQQRVQITYGKCLRDVQDDGASNAAAKNGDLSKLAAAHPFIQQERPSLLDFVFPASDDLRDKLCQLSTQYCARTWTLAAFTAFAQTHVQKFSAESDLIALGKPGHLDDDVWCLDTRGVLTLAVCKTTYEQLGLVGKHLPWKEQQDTFVIRISLLAQAIPLKDEQCHPCSPKVKAALAAWDTRRGPWDVIFHIPTLPAESEIQTLQVQPTVRIVENVHIPQPKLTPRPSGSSKDSSAVEEWDEGAHELFEWAGLACLGSDRLRVNDRPDPYIAVYTPPSSIRTGSLTHIRWKGLLPPMFVKAVVDTAKQASFACIAADSIPISPVTYAPPPPSLRYPKRAPRRESEDCWSAVITNSGEDTEMQWLLAESIGRWDSRWG